MHHLLLIEDDLELARLVQRLSARSGLWRYQLWQ